MGADADASFLLDAVTETDPAAEKRDEKHMPLCRAGELAGLWRQGGMEDVEERPLDTSMTFASFVDYWEPFLLGQGPAGAYVRTLEPARLQTLRAALKKQLGVTSEASRLKLPARVWAVSRQVRSSYARENIARSA